MASLCPVSFIFECRLYSAWGKKKTSTQIDFNFGQSADFPPGNNQRAGLCFIVLCRSKLSIRFIPQREGLWVSMWHGTCAHLQNPNSVVYQPAFSLMLIGGLQGGVPS